MCSDFSGRRPNEGIHMNKFDDYVDLFKQFGEIVHIIDYKGSVLKSEIDTNNSYGIIMATLK